MSLTAFNRARRVKAAREAELLVVKKTNFPQAAGYGVPIDTVFPLPIAELDSKELKTLAKERGLKGYTKKSDEELISMLRGETGDDNATSDE